MLNVPEKIFYNIFYPENSTLVCTIESGFEFFTLQETGESGLSQAGLANLCGVTRTSISKMIGNIFNQDIKDIKGISSWQKEDGILAIDKKNGGGFHVIKIELCCEILNYFAQSKHSKISSISHNSLVRLLHIKPALSSYIKPQQQLCIQSTKVLNPESLVRNRLAQELKGIVEVPCLAGKVDVLTSTEIIEVKQMQAWKAAIGQILIYGFYFPSLIKRIHLYRITNRDKLDIIQSHCNRFDVRLTIEK